MGEHEGVCESKEISIIILKKVLHTFWGTWTGFTYICWSHHNNCKVCSRRFIYRVLYGRVCLLSFAFRTLHNIITLVFTRAR